MTGERWTTRVGRMIGNWNDHRFAADTRSTSPRVWHMLDRVAAYLYASREHGDG